MEQIKKFTEEFFRNLKCGLFWNGDVLVVENVPRGFEDLVGKNAPYKLSFVSGVDDAEFVGKGSRMLLMMTKYLEGAGKATLLRIDFEVDAEAEIRKRVGLKNCEIESLVKRYKNSFFSRFSFVTSFNYLNESERVLSEVYVYEGKVVDGDLSGYSVVDSRESVSSRHDPAGPGVGSRESKIDTMQVRKDYVIAKERSIELTKGKQKEISGVLKEKVEVEIDRIREHYDRQLRELGGDLNGKLGKIREVELELRSRRSVAPKGVPSQIQTKDELGQTLPPAQMASADADKVGNVLRKRLERLRMTIVKSGDDEVVGRILKERDMTIGDAMQKFSLNVDRRLVNTTVIYYPRYIFKLHLALNGHDSGEPKNSEVAGRLMEVSYDPLTRNFSGLDCEGCSRRLDRINLCENGHVCCEDCLDRCGECGGFFCVRCLGRSCGSCGRKLCKGCVKMCLACGGSVCSTHLRKDCVSGEDRCVSCLRACLRCHGMCEERFFGEALDGSKVCGKCLGIEKSGKVLERVFR